MRDGDVSAIQEVAQQADGGAAVQVCSVAVVR